LERLELKEENNDTKTLGYSNELWNKYTDDNTESLVNSPAKFIHHICLGLGVKKICELGCNLGNNLVDFSSEFDITGVDLNQNAINKAKKKFSSFDFKVAKIQETSFLDSQFDLVYTRGVLIHVPEKDLNDALKEIFRISKKWIFNLEYFGEDGKMIPWKRGEDLLWYRNMKEKWSDFDVEIISDVEIPLEVDSGKMRFTLVRKN
jgi:predicted TPR repeat methyltransferase